MQIAGILRKSPNDLRSSFDYLPLLMWIIELSACSSGMWLPSWRRLSCSVSLPNYLR